MELFLLVLKVLAVISIVTAAIQWARGEWPSWRGSDDTWKPIRPIQTMPQQGQRGTLGRDGMTGVGPDERRAA
jgi:hypothetical protein